MKKILLVLLVLLGLQTQAQISPCDSMTVTGSQYQLTMEVNNINTFIDYWVTTAPDMTVLAEDSMTNTHSVFNSNPVSFVPYDTIITCITSSSAQITCCVTWVWNGTMWMKIGSQQLNLCDSLSYTTSTNIPTWPLIVTGNIATIPGMLSWSWSVCNSTTCYSDTGQVGYFGQVYLSDTLKVCYDVYVDINGATYMCTSCDSLVYDGNQWVALTGNPTSIQEISFYNEADDKMYDMLGREITDVKIGVLYIRNNKKYIKIN